MRFLLAFLTLAVVAVGAGASRAAQLEALKRAMPGHINGAVTERSHAVTQRYFAKYRGLVDRLRVEDLAEQVLRLRETAHDDIIDLRIIEQNRNRTFDQNTRTAARQNASWIKQRLMPYITRIEQFQRGR